ncbi:NAD-dependent epimerase/dehydratase family protein [Croceicoccus naphthovorans]|uniref:Epimerase n=1 Tax=Croceicoccus naphthovorans TaxID=1348774 RepID=A0A0G3XJA7_9SPHN|nr:NAD(P)H-binding protein [Croceicoccus naphthovorans]AKM10696.1 epimerase [Croceicoccus naphthovorans]MBB3992185.1 nucleoside-diphosphate-sugar epimerase [Croceicoccus naphthovorans]
MIIALTGATGFVGSTLLDLALAEGHSVRALTRREQPAREGVEWVRGDLAAADALRALCEGADAVVHVAGVVNAPDNFGFVSGNVTGTQAVVDAAKAAGVGRFVQVSSLAAREPNLSDYGNSKAGAEAVVERSGLDWAMVRPPAIYGPRDTEMFELFRAAKLGVVPLPPEGRASMIHVSDLAALLLALAVTPAHAGQVYEADDGVDGGWRHVEMARAIGDAVGRKVIPISMPAALVKGAAQIDRLIRRGKAKLTPDRAGYMMHPDWTADPAKRPPAGLWQPRIETREGLRATADWYRNAGWL